MDLESYTVLEVGEYVTVPYAGKLLSGLGADVVKVEPPAGDVSRRVGPFADDDPRPDRSGYFAALNTDKRSITLDPDADPAPDAIRGLVRALDVDLVIEDRLADYGVDPRALADEFASLSVVSVSAFGATGPWSEHEAPEIVAVAESGQMNKMGYPHRPPTRLRIKALDYIAGIYAALAALAALYHRDANGADGRFVDLARREAGTSSMEYFLAGYSWSGHTTERSGSGYPDQGPEESIPTILEAKDGHFSSIATPAGMWEAFCEQVLERPELLEDERFATVESRADHLDAIRELTEEYTRERGKWDLLSEFQAAGIASAVTATPEDIVRFEQLEAREFWQEIPLPDGTPATLPGFPFRVNGDRVEMGRAPRLGEHDAELYAALDVDAERLVAARDGDGRGHEGGDAPRASSGDRDRRSPPLDPGEGEDRPLEGIRVIDFTWIGAGPQATKFLAGLGADVVKIESLAKPDTLRLMMTFDYDPTETLDASPFFAEFNQGKRSLQLDLSTDRGRALARDLIAEADVLAENFSPEFMGRIGFDYESVREFNPELVYLSMPGWGKEGPAKGFRSYGNQLQSMAGLDWISGFPDDPPTTSGQSWPDPVAGVVGTVATAMGLLHRARTGEGTYIEVPQYETTVQFLHKPLVTYLMHDRLPERMGNRDEDFRYAQGVYPCAGDDRWAAVAIGDDGQWERFCSVIGRPDLADDERFGSRYDRLANHDALDEVVAAWTAERSPEEVRARLQDHDVPAGVVANERDLMDFDPQLRARDYFPEYDFPAVGRQRCGGIPFRMQGARIGFDRYPPSFGEHTDEVLSEWLGMTEAEIGETRAAEVLH